MEEREALKQCRNAEEAAKGEASHENNTTEVGKLAHQNNEAAEEAAAAEAEAQRLLKGNRYFVNAALCGACENGMTRAAVRLVRHHNADVRHQSFGGLTALHLAASNGHTDTVRALVKELGADSNAKASDGSTPPHCAASKGHFDAARALVTELGADASLEDNLRKTPLARVHASHRAVFEAFLPTG